MSLTRISASVVVILSCAYPLGLNAATPLKRQTLLSQFRPASPLIPVAFFDADSTLRVALSGNVTATRADDVALLPCVGPRLRQLADEGFFIAIISNQGGVGTGKTPLEVAEGALATAAQQITATGGVVHYFDFAEGKEGEDPARKPATGMATRLEQFFQRTFGNPGFKIDPVRSFMVGDSAYKSGTDVRPDGRPGTHFSNGDRLLAENLAKEKKFTTPRAPWKTQIFYEPGDFFGWRQVMGTDKVVEELTTSNVTDARGATRKEVDMVFSNVAEVGKFMTRFPKACCAVSDKLPGCQALPIRH